MDLSEGLTIQQGGPQPGYLEQVQREQTRCITIWAEHYGLSQTAYLAKVRAHMLEMMQGAQPWIRIPASAFKEVLTSGRLKTMEETGLHGTSGQGAMPAAASYREGRRANELAMFSIPFEEVEGRPIYGYLSRDVDGQVDLDRSVLGAWGEVAVRLKPSILERTTVTFDDSGAMGRRFEGCPSPALAPELHSFRYMVHHEGASVYNPPSGQGKFDEAKYPDPLQIKGPDGPGFPSYFEAHYLGGVKVQDFAEVIWGKELEFGATPTLDQDDKKDLAVHLRHLGITSRNGYRQQGVAHPRLVVGSEEVFQAARQELEREYDRLISAFKKPGGSRLREQLGANGWSGQPLDRDEWTRLVHRKRR